MVAALTLDGIGPLVRFDGAMTTARFEGYIRHFLAPTLRPGQVVVAENLRAHHSPAVRAAIEARGARFLPLPAYSPAFTSIEEAFSKVKQSLRRAQARTDDDLRAATWAAFATITASDAAAGWFTHCGYPRAIKPHEKRCTRPNRNASRRRNARWNAAHKQAPPPIWWRGHLEPMVRVELTTYRLRGGCSATELHRHCITSPVNNAP